MKRTAYFTICARNYLAIARACLHSLLATDPDARVLLVLCDEIGEDYDPGKERFEVITADAVDIPDFSDMVLRYDVMELSTAIKPFVFDHLFRDGHERVVYCDPDLYFLRRLDHVHDAFDQGQDAVVTPHICEPIRDAFLPNDQSMLQVGVYNLGFLALRNAPDSRAFALWWADKLRKGAVVDLPNGLFTDQKWCDLLPCFVARTTILRHPGYNLAYWNLMHRPVTRRGTAWFAGGEPIHFVHFSGAGFDDESVFSKHQNRFKAGDLGPLRALYDEYRALVRENGLAACRRLAYRYDKDADGRPIPRLLRVLYRDDVAPATAAEPLDGLTAKARLERALAHANAPAALADGPARPWITNLMHRVWRDRPDLQRAFDLGADEGRVAFARWYLDGGWKECGVDDRFVAPVRAALEKLKTSRASGSLAAQEVMIPSDGAGATPDTLGGAYRAFRPILRPLLQALPIETQRRLQRWNQRRLHGPVEARIEVATAPPPARPISRAAAIEAAAARAALAQEAAARSRIVAHPEPGAVLIGYGRAELGMGEHVRMTAAALASRHAPFGIYNVAVGVVARQDDRRFDGMFVEENRYRANILHINADQLDIVRESIGEKFFEGRTNIAYPAWELATLPDPWIAPLRRTDEIWAPSNFVRDAIAAKVDRPVVTMPLAVELAEGYGRWRRGDFGVPEDAFVVLFNFDLASMSGRKNPGAVIQAFDRAFPDRRDGKRRPHLVIKALSADLHPAALAALRAQVGDDPTIQIITDTYSPDKVHGLVNVADVFVSLHRSEGFGRGPAEAMRLGKPVIATGYGGNVDFMTRENSFLIGHRLIPVGEGEYPFWEGQVWADPDVAEAGDILAGLHADRALAARVGAKAQADMIAGNSRETVGEACVARLRKIGAL
jgi:glycosyltransferase involved in cell wall biosynthesis